MTQPKEKPNLVPVLTGCLLYLLKQHETETALAAVVNATAHFVGMTARNRADVDRMVEKADREMVEYIVANWALLCFERANRLGYREPEE